MKGIPGTLYINVPTATALVCQIAICQNSIYNVKGCGILIYMSNAMEWVPRQLFPMRNIRERLNHRSKSCIVTKETTLFEPHGTHRCSTRVHNTVKHTFIRPDYWATNQVLGEDTYLKNIHVIVNITRNNQMIWYSRRIYSQLSSLYGEFLRSEINHIVFIVIRWRNVKIILIDQSALILYNLTDFGICENGEEKGVHFQYLQTRKRRLYLLKYVSTRITLPYLYYLHNLLIH